MKGRALHLLRHGAVVQAGRLIGHSDALPTQEGLAACRDRARGLQAARVIASDLTRARASGEQIAQDQGLPCQLDPRWRELHFGAWEGRDPADLGAQLQGFWDDPQNSPPPGGERWNDLQARVGAALAGVDEDALIITHAGPMRAALALLLRLDYRQSWAFHLPYAALISLRVWDDGAQITGLSA